MEFAKKEKNVTVALRRFVKLYFYNLFFIALIFLFLFCLGHFLCNVRMIVII